MSELSATDRELLKLRAAKMSTKTIAMLMGGRWTEARVYNRLAEIDGQAEPKLPDLPLHHRIDEDLPADPFEMVLAPEGELELFERIAPWPDEPKIVVIGNPAPASRLTPWMRQAIDFTGPALPARDPVILGVDLGDALVVSVHRFPATAQGATDASPAVEVLDIEPPPLSPAASPAEPADDAPQADAGGPVHAQTHGAEAPEAVAGDEELAAAPNPLAVEARPFVPVHKVRARAPRRPVEAAAPNLLAAPAPPPARPAPGRPTRLRPLTDKIAGYAQRFATARWPIDEIAWLFDVSPESLEKVLA